MLRCQLVPGLSVLLAPDRPRSKVPIVCSFFIYISRRLIVILLRHRRYPRLHIKGELVCPNNGLSIVRVYRVFFFGSFQSFAGLMWPPVYQIAALADVRVYSCRVLRYSALVSFDLQRTAYSPSLSRPCLSTDVHLPRHRFFFPPLLSQYRPWEHCQYSQFTTYFVLTYCGIPLLSPPS